METLIYRWETGHRYYFACLHPNLWGEWVLTKCWGGKNSRRGGISHVKVDGKEQGLNELATLDKVRRRRGYDRVGV